MRDLLGLACLAGLLALLALLLAPAAAAEPVTLRVTGTNSGENYWFEVDGYPGQNPTLSLRSGDEVTVEFRNLGQNPHNIHFGSPLAKGSEYVAPGQSTTFRFTVPGGLKPQVSHYWCDPHRQIGMVGDVLLAGAGAPGGGEAETPHPLPAPPSLAFAALAFAAVAAWRRRRP